jgi:hypothetical protein
MTRTITAAMSILFVVSNLLTVFSKEFSIFHFSIHEQFSLAFQNDKIIIKTNRNADRPTAA